MGYEATIIDELKHLDNVKEVHGVFGAHDILTKIESDSAENLRDTINWKIRKLSSVRSTLTLMVTEKQD